MPILAPPGQPQSVALTFPTALGAAAPAGDRAYHAYRGSRALQARYGVDDLVLLTVAPHRQRLLRIAQEIATATHAADGRYLLLDTRHLHPGSVRATWQQITAVQAHRRRVVDQLVEERRPTLSTVALWAAP